MEYEGRDYSWITGLYWTLTVMSTLGFGDITFYSDLGRGFSVIVLVTGMISLLILLPFSFIEFFYAPWLKAQSRKRTPRKLPEDMRNHVLISHLNSVTEALIDKLQAYNYDYVLIVGEQEKALDYHDKGYNVILGEFDNPKTYQNAQVNQASLVVAIGTDMVNSNICNTVREVDEDVKIVATATSVDSIDLLKLAGSNYVLRMGDMMGKTLSRRTIGQDSRVHVVGHIDELVVAEAMAYQTPLVGKTLQESNLRERLGINLVGIWERGKYLKPRADLIIQQESVLIMAGTVEQFRAYDEQMSDYRANENPVIIIGAGRVGEGIAKAFTQRRIDFRIIDKDPSRIKENDDRYILGSAEDIKM